MTEGIWAAGVDLPRHCVARQILLLFVGLASQK